jgi:hypothetical protein
VRLARDRRGTARSALAGCPVVAGGLPGIVATGLTAIVLLALFVARVGALPRRLGLGLLARDLLLPARLPAELLLIRVLLVALGAFGLLGGSHRSRVDELTVHR